VERSWLFILKGKQTLCQVLSSASNDTQDFHRFLLGPKLLQL
jgi:hypothetical protein